MCSGVFEEMRAVPHNLKYHAEISYQCMEGSELVDGLTWAAGNTFIDLLDDIETRYDQYKDRGFRIENAVLLGKRDGKQYVQQNITWKITEMFQRRLSEKKA